jgi:aminomethyltransferase
MPNASNTERVVTAVGGVDTTDSRCIIAVQGPRARAALAILVPEAAAVPRFGVATFEWDGVPCLVAGTGYTGEDGVECAVPVEAARSLWDALVAAGIGPAGLGARDTLRLEAALPLHGHELGPGITPLQAGLGWVVGWDKEHFSGRDALERERRAGVARRLVGLATPGRQPPREGSALEDGDRTVGIVTSGNFSPMLGHGIALGLVDAALPAGTGADLGIRQRGRSLAATVVATPFVRAGQWAVR